MPGGSLLTQWLQPPQGPAAQPRREVRLGVRAAVRHRSDAEGGCELPLDGEGARGQGVVPARGAGGVRPNHPTGAPHHTPQPPQSPLHQSSHQHAGGAVTSPGKSEFYIKEFTGGNNETVGFLFRRGWRGGHRGRVDSCVRGRLLDQGRGGLLPPLGHRCLPGGHRANLRQAN